MANISVSIFGGDLGLAETLTMTDAGKTSLPFPFNVGYPVRVLIAIGLAATFVAGSYFRILIVGRRLIKHFFVLSHSSSVPIGFHGIHNYVQSGSSKKFYNIGIQKYLLEPSTKMGPINVLIWTDQLNGAFLALNIAGRIAAFLIPFPMSRLTGDKFCTWSPLPGQLYLVGATVWSSMIAFYRILYIRKQEWIKKILGDETFLRILLLTGLVVSFVSSYLLAYYDYQGVNKKICTHLSDEDFELLYAAEAAFGPTEYIKESRKYALFVVNGIGVLLNVIKMASYTLFFIHLTHHNNTVGLAILEPSIIKQRNRMNAVSMLGQIITWVFEVWYIIIVGFLSTYLDMNIVREVSTLIKNLDFLIIPLVQIATSPSMKLFCIESIRARVNLN